MTSIFENAREISPYRWLFMATLGAVALALCVSMALVTQSQVRKAEAHYASQGALASVAKSSAVAEAQAPAQARNQPVSTHAGGVMNVGYVVNR